MSSRSNRFFYTIALAVLVFAGWACDKFGKGSATPSNGQVVATVGGHTITFGDWMKQLDLLRVFDTPVDPDNSQQVKAVLETLINQELLLSAAQKANYTDPNFDEFLKNKLVQADIRLKDQKERLAKDMKALERVEKDYKDAYKKVLLARGFAANQVSKVEVSERDLQSWYAQYSARAERAGQRMPPYSKVNTEIKKEIKQNVQAEKFLENLQEGTKIDRNEDAIKKYLDSLSPSQQMLNAKEASEEGAPAPAAPAAKKK